jgi:hypothetical protein
MIDNLISRKPVFDGLCVQLEEVTALAKLPLHSAGPDDDPGP